MRNGKELEQPKSNVRKNKKREQEKKKLKNEDDEKSERTNVESFEEEKEEKSETKVNEDMLLAPVFPMALQLRKMVNNGPKFFRVLSKSQHTTY